MITNPNQTADVVSESKLPARIRAIRNISIVILCLLISQYVLGMGANLFVNFPTEVAGVNPLDSAILNGPYLVSFHIINGLALGLLSIAEIVLGALVRKRGFLLAAIFGFAAIFFAGESGIEFVLGWYTADLLSFLMSLGFIISFGIYFILVWYSNQRTSSFSFTKSVEGNV